MIGLLPTMALDVVATLGWVVVMLVGFAGSALFSGMETGAYSLNRVRLHILAHEASRFAARLERELQRTTRLLATLLIGNNITNYMGTAALAVILEAQGVSDGRAIVLNTLIVTPLLFVFGETLPKDLFAAHADRLMYRLTPVLIAARQLFTWTGLAPVVVGFGTGVMRLIGSDDSAALAHPRRRFERLVKEGVGYGLLSDAQSALIDRVLKAGELTLAQIGRPWTQAVTIATNADAKAIAQCAKKHRHSFFPVVDAKGKATGVVNILDALIAEQDEPGSWKKTIKPAMRCRASMPARAALTNMQRQGQALTIIVNERDQAIRLVSLKDLIEPVTGRLEHWS